MVKGRQIGVGPKQGNFELELSLHETIYLLFLLAEVDQFSLDLRLQPSRLLTVFVKSDIDKALLD